MYPTKCTVLSGRRLINSISQYVLYQYKYVFLMLYSYIGCVKNFSVGVEDSDTRPFSELGFCLHFNHNQQLQPPSQCTASKDIYTCQTRSLHSCVSVFTHLISPAWTTTHPLDTEKYITLRSQCFDNTRLHKISWLAACHLWTRAIVLESWDSSKYVSLDRICSGFELAYVSS